MNIPTSLREWNQSGADYLPGRLGIEFTLVEPDEVRARMDVSRELCAWNGYLHGGAVVSLADTACGYGTVRSLPGDADGFTTVELKTNFLGTALEGTVLCTARPLHQGRTTQVWDAEITAQATGKAIAHFRCTQMILRPVSGHDTPRPHGLHPDHRVDRELLAAAVDWLERTREPREHPVPEDASTPLPDALPEIGLGAGGALDRLAPVALGGSAQLHHPGYFAHMDPPTPAVAWAAALWQAAANQNLLHPDAAPAARGLERRVVAWLAPAFGMDGGHLVPGSTVGNLTALWAARELAGVRRVVASDRAHLSIRKAADLLGLHFEPVTTGRDHRLSAGTLPELDDAALVLTAGTVATGALDPLARPDAPWVHVDAAWGGPLRLTGAHAALLDGIESADSVALSAHKWLYQPKGSALVLFRDAARAHQALSYGGGYLAAPNVGLLGSAPASALPLAATLLAWGREGLAARIEADMARAERLAALVRADERFELWGPNRSGVVVWRPRGQDARAVRARLRDAWVSLTEIDGEVWLRSVAANPSADPDHVLARVVAAL